MQKIQVCRRKVSEHKKVLYRFSLKSVLQYVKAIAFLIKKFKLTVETNVFLASTVNLLHLG